MLRKAIVSLAISLGGAVVASAGDVQSVRAALRARAAHFDHVRITAEWRSRRAPADQPRPDAWKELRPAADVVYSMTCRVVRPNFGLRIIDGNPIPGNPPTGPLNYAWVSGEFEYLLVPPEGQRASYIVVPHRQLGAMRGKVVLTPLELEFFDIKQTFLELLDAAHDVSVTAEDGGTVLVEFPRPDWYQIIRARFDPQRDWVPLMMELYTKPAGQRTKPLSWKMLTQKTMAVAGTFIIDEAWVINSNPMVLPDEVDVSTFDVTKAEPDPELTADDLRLTPPTSNVFIQDTVRMHTSTIDKHGNLIEDRAIAQEELDQEARNWATHAREMERRAKELHKRPYAFALIVLAAALAAGGGGFLVWRRARAA